MSSLNSPVRARSPQKHTSIEASSPTTRVAPAVRTNRGLKAAALGAVAIAAVSGVAYFANSHKAASNNQNAATFGSHDQTFEGMDACAADWGQCGGANWNGATCCSGAGSFCSAQSEWYSQCLPAGSNPFPAFTTQPTPATPAPTAGGCVADWGQCGGVNYNGIQCCATQTSGCWIQSDWYSQCLPAGTAPFPLVDYSFDQIVDGVVLNPRTLYNGREIGGVSQVAGYAGQAIQLNGVDGTVSIPNSAGWDFSASGFTLEANVKRFNAFDSEDAIITKWYAPDAFLLKFEDNTLVFSLNYVTASYQTITYSFADSSYQNSWQFVKASYERTGASGSTMKLWWNGNLVGSKSVDDNVIVRSGMAVRVGNTNNDWSFFDGSIDNVKIWSAAV